MNFVTILKNQFHQSIRYIASEILFTRFILSPLFYLLDTISIGLESLPSHAYK